MLRGLLAGSAWGAVVGAVVLAMTSQIADWRDLTPAVGEDVAQANPAATTPADPQPAPETTPSPDVPVTSAPLPETAAPADNVASPAPEVSPPGTPATAGDVTAPASPDTDIATAPSPAPELPVADAGSTADVPVAPETDIATAPGAQVTPPSAPAAPAEVARPESPSAEIAGLPAPSPESGITTNPLGPPPSNAPSSLPQVVPQPDPIETAALPDPNAPRAPGAPESGAAAPTTPGVAPAPELAQREVIRPPVSGPGSSAGNTDTEAPEAGDSEDRRLPQVRVTELPQVSGGGDAGGEPDIVARTETVPVPSNTGPRVAVRINRLPTIGDNAPDEGDAEDVPEPDAADAGDADAIVEDVGEADPDAPAILRNAVGYEGDAATPVISVILVDMGQGLPSSSDLADLPIPVTVAVDAALTDAARLARRYRERGAEVALIPNLPAGARAQDVAVSLSTTLDEVLDAVALLDSTGADFQTDREAMAQVAAMAAETGHGVVTFARGLNSARRLAEQQGVPSGLIFRALDADSGDALSVARALDQAAFRARQDGSAIIMVPSNDAVLAGLVGWSLESRATAVSLAPLSQVLRVGGS